MESEVSSLLFCGGGSHAFTLHLLGRERVAGWWGDTVLLINTPFLRGAGGECGGRVVREDGMEEVGAKGRNRENCTWWQGNSGELAGG